MFDRFWNGKLLKRSCKSQYEEEIRKQKNSYYGWITDVEEKQKYRRIDANGPSFTVYLYQSGYLSAAEIEFCRRSVWNQSCRPLKVMEHVNYFDFSQAEGDYILFVNAKGILPTGALEILSGHLLDGGWPHRKADMVYSDSDELDVSIGMGGGDKAGEKYYRNNPWFKPDWSPDTLLAFQYFGELVCIRKELAQRIEIIEKQDFERTYYDFLLKVSEQSERIEHIQKILFHRWGIDEGELEREAERYPVKAQGWFGQIKEEALKRRGYRAVYEEIARNKPLISIIIPSKDNVKMLKRCVQSLKENTEYSNYQIIVIDNGSKEEFVTELEKLAKELGFWYFPVPMDFNYSILNQIGVSKAEGEYYLFLNDDIEVLSGNRNWLFDLLKQAALPHSGAVGAKLLYPSGHTIQHIGITNLKIGPSHKMATYPDGEPYYFGRNTLTYNVLGVTGACLMLSRAKYQEIGGFSDEYAVTYGDVDLCVKLLEKGYYNTVLNQVVLWHHESVSRGLDTADHTRHERLLREKELFYQQHAWLRGTDPFYNPNLIQDDITYEPEYRPDWRNREIFHSIQPLDISLPNPDQRSGLQYNVESIQLIGRTDLHGLDYYQIEGWSLFTKSNNCEFERYLIIEYNGKKYYAFVSPKMRADVCSVYAEAKYAELSGWVCRVEKEKLEALAEGREFRLPALSYGIAARSRYTRSCYYTGLRPIEKNIHVYE